MPFVDRDVNNVPCGYFSIRQSPGQEYLPDDSTEYLAYLAQAARDGAIDSLFNLADGIALAGCDRNAREKFLHLTFTPGTPPLQLARINDVFAWLDAVWYQYAVAKAAVMAGNVAAELPPIPPCPWTFWEVVMAS